MGTKKRPKLGREKQRAVLPAAVCIYGGTIVGINRCRRLIQCSKQICADVPNGCAGFLHTVQHIGDMKTVKLTKAFPDGGNGNFLAADADAWLCCAKRIVQQFDDGLDGFFAVFGDQDFVVQLFIKPLSAIETIISIRFLPCGIDGSG